MTYPVLIIKFRIIIRFINKDGSNNLFQHIILGLRSSSLCVETSNFQNSTQKVETVEYMHLSSGNLFFFGKSFNKNVYLKLLYT